MDLIVEVGVRSSAAFGITACSGCGRARRLEQRFSKRQEKAREKLISAVEIGAATNRDDLWTKASEPDRHAAVVGLLLERRSRTIGCSTSSASSFAAALFQVHQARCCLRPRSADPEGATTSRPTQTTRVEMAWWRERTALDLRTAARESGLDSGRLRAELVRSLVDFEANAV